LGLDLIQPGVVQIEQGAQGDKDKKEKYGGEWLNSLIITHGISPDSCYWRSILKKVYAANAAAV
jgi:hypothetical protein